MTKISKNDIQEIDGILTATVYGKAAQCPYFGSNVVPHPTITGQLAMMGKTCSEECVFFNIQNDVDESEYLQPGCKPYQYVKLSCSDMYILPSDQTILQKGIKSGLNQTAAAEQGTNGLKLIKP
jgi:hypothetical protein